MTPDDVKQIREALGAVIGRRVSQRDLGLVLGLSEGNADRAVREWETTGPTGPAAVALSFMAIAMNDYNLDVHSDFLKGGISQHTYEDMQRIVQQMFDGAAP